MPWSMPVCLAFLPSAPPPCVAKSQPTGPGIWCPIALPYCFRWGHDGWLAPVCKDRDAGKRGIHTGDRTSGKAG
ncbi:hypothetical protein IWX90DRAFT_441262 [Phyllosticta citrichinensis]|uniref:Secreted protein n=1 Tax=Phyllosticta citrichinensis TaxID=1130410 RepID=A0ABR1XLT5_9PEZI